MKEPLFPKQNIYPKTHHCCMDLAFLLVQPSELASQGIQMAWESGETGVLVPELHIW